LCQPLGITYIAANSPEAKGGVERILFLYGWHDGDLDQFQTMNCRY
jgi:hypothetical protein